MKTYSPQDWKEMQNESWKTFTPKHTVKLPCGHGFVEAQQGQDQYLECPECKKRWLLNWQPHSKPKLYR